ncbi:SIMPL domain-containing protein [Solirubrobacter ginsenosidimutans]|uniref:SIMPL domain-containing protein n=1 Tax=Solirubrobacter ginsenosidimutans TaxID=490573 RepID=A0A9X3MPZ2_9ACTN|nr:SIMPL domain-containing protein [Solirubrobacter ginsenosidimutans]MDA0159095.1 SIMPL domain-containing protein [Solirubrobacter ginsenosidimutans]
MPGRPVGLIATSAVLLAAALFPTAASAQAPATTLTAAGVGQSAPKPDDPKSERSIREAVEAAEASALPKAVAEGKAHAVALAAAAGLTLGALISISDSPPNSYPFYYQFGTFPNGHYCGNVRRVKTVVRNGKRVRVAAGTRRVCRVPPQVSASVQLTYAVTPAA